MPHRRGQTAQADLTEGTDNEELTTNLGAMFGDLFKDTTAGTTNNRESKSCRLRSTGFLWIFQVLPGTLIPSVSHMGGIHADWHRWLLIAAALIYWCRATFAGSDAPNRYPSPCCHTHDWGSFITVPLRTGRTSISFNIGGGLIPLVWWLFPIADTAKERIRSLLYPDHRRRCLWSAS